MDMTSLFGEKSAVVACCPGRLRLSVPTLYRSDDEKSKIESVVSRHEGVEAVFANPLTGRVLILFHVSVPAETILVALGIQAAPEERASRKNEAPMTPAVRRTDDRPHTFACKEVRQRAIYPPWHLRSADEALAFHDSSAQAGLTRAVVEDRLRHGWNVLPQPQGRSSLDILMGQFKGLPVLLLGASAILSVLTGGLSEALAIVAVLSLNAGIGFATERRAESTIASLSDLVDDSVPVLRDGEVRQVEASQIVVGDIMVLMPGVRVAADARIVQSNGISLDESALTGESRTITKHAPALVQDAALADRINMAYMGTVVTAGAGLAVTVGTGRNTEIGLVQSLMERTEQPRTPIQKQLDRLGNQLITSSVGICAGVFAIGLLRSFGWLHMLKASISLAIAAVPEGLPTVATTSLARSIRLMKQRQMLIRRLQAVETLGAIHTICLDKTGTLTMNKMSVVDVRLDSGSCEVTNGKLSPHGEPWQSGVDDALSRLVKICVLCNEGEVRSNGTPSSGLNGSATENALIELALSAGVSVNTMRAHHPLLRAELRADDRNYMSTVRALPASTGYFIAVKGSPAEVLALCESRLTGNRAMPLTIAHKAAIAEQNRCMAEKQLRVLGFAYAQTTELPDGPSTKNLVWVGLAGLADPLRPGAEAAIASLHCAGIRTTMVTGDQSTTAHAIGTSLRLGNGRALHILESDRLERLDPDALKVLVAQADIFARVSPAHKLKIVRALQACGEVVAMTGDGINDGPALKASDVGIAMGLRGTDLARSAADVVLEDDRLETVLEAIREGRTLTMNIRKSLHFLISSNMSEILVVLSAISAGAPAPLSPMQLLWINLLGDVLPAIALAAEPAEGHVMQQPPRDASKPLIGTADLKRYARESVFLSAGTLAAYFFGLARHGAGARASTIAFNALTLGQLLHALSCRSDRHGVLLATQAQVSNKLNLAIAASIALQLLANLVPGLRRLLGVAPMGAIDIAAVLAGAGVPLLMNEVSKPGRASNATDGARMID